MGSGVFLFATPRCGVAPFVVYSHRMQCVGDWKGNFAMSVSRSKSDGRWRFRVVGTWSDGVTERVSGSAPKNDNTKAAAQRAEAQQLAFMAAHPKPTSDATEDTQNNKPAPHLSLVPSLPPVPTVEEFAPTFLASAGVGNKESTREDRAKRMRLYILPSLGHLRLDELDFAKIDDFKTSLHQRETNLATKTMQAGMINVLLKLVKQILIMAKRRKLIAEVPEIEYLKAPESKTDFLSFDEADRLVAAADGDWRTMIITALRTGVRRGELMAIRRDAVNLFSRKLDVKSSYYRGRFTLPKSNKTRSIPLSGHVRAVLDTHRPGCAGLLFCDEAGVPYSNSRMNTALNRICLAAGITRHIGWHVLRHTFASHLVMRGVSLRVVQDLMGHSSILQTQRYAHLAPHVSVEAVELLDAPAPAVPALEEMKMAA